MAKKKKILLLSDDLRMASGIATMSKELVLGTAHKYDWFQVGAAINHPEAGKVLDVSQDIQERYVTDIEFRESMNEYLKLQISGSQF